jgi:hypothetical protein
MGEKQKNYERYDVGSTTRAECILYINGHVSDAVGVKQSVTAVYEE